MSRRLAVLSGRKVQVSLVVADSGFLSGRRQSHTRAIGPTTKRVDDNRFLWPVKRILMGEEWGKTALFLD